MAPDLLKALVDVGPLEKRVQTSMPTSPDMEDIIKHSAHAVRFQQLQELERLEKAETAEADAEAKRALPKHRQSQSDEDMESEWRSTKASTGSGKLSESQALELFNSHRDDEPHPGALADTFGLDEAVVKTLLLNYGAPHLRFDANNDIYRGTWNPREGPNIEVEPDDVREGPGT